MNERKYIATIGFFDGFHLGHQKLVRSIIELQKLNKHLVNSHLVMSFDHVEKIRNNLIYPVETKIEIIRNFGVEKIKIFHFDKIKKLSPEIFFEKFFLISNIKILVVGEDFRFGYKKKGSIGLLSKLCISHNICLFIVKDVKVRVGDSIKRISSSLVRNYITNSCFDKVENLLGRKYYVSGQIFKGKGIGSAIGIETINFRPDNGVLVPKGVFAGEALIYGKNFKAVANFGFNPTIEKSEKIICEVHIIDSKIKSKINEISFRPIKKIREEKKFNNIEVLRLNMLEDINKAKMILSRIKTN